MARNKHQIEFVDCRCQAFALTGDASNIEPACSLSHKHAEWANVAEVESHAEAPALIYRRMAGAKATKSPGEPADAG